MANIFTIKHGAEIPPDNTLQPYELGYAENGGLVIGDAEGKTKTISPERVAEATNAIKITKDGKSVIQLRVNLGSTGWCELDGSGANDQNQLQVGVVNVLPLIRGGLGVDASTPEGQATARSNLGISLDKLQASITGAATTITENDLIVNRALISNDSGKVAVSAVTSTELGYLGGVTSAIQTQLNGKADKAGYTASRALVSDSSGNLTVSSTITTTELGYLDGVTKNIQNQLNEKVSIATFDSGLTGTGTSEVGIITMGNLTIEYGLFTANTTWTGKEFVTKFSDIPALSFIPIGSGTIAQVKLQDTASVTTKGFIVSTSSGSATYRYVAIGLVDN